ncbi:MAG: TonB-dependent receptor [Bacteroidota bacterium]
MKKLSLVVGLLLCSIATLLAQRTITGTVVDEQNEALIGTTVLVKGTAVGTVTDIDGKYSVEVPADATILVFSYTGYSSKEMEITASNVMDVTLDSDVIGLEDVVVVGYAPVKRKNLTGSVQSIDGADINAEAGATIQSGIRRAAGVVVQQASGAPGAGFNIRVRGATSITASNEPLFVVDGIPMVAESFLNEDNNTLGGQNTNSLADLNPAEIESIEILKDASTTAIYGSRAANGVVLITTKRGSAGKTKVDFNASYGFNDAIRTIPVVNNEQYREYITGIFGTDQLPWVNEGVSNDWQNLIFDQNPIQQYGVNITGGDVRTKFFLGMNYDDNQGALNGTQFTRYSGRLNLDHQVTDRFKTSMNLGFTRSINKLIQNDNNIFGAVSTAILLPPTLPIRNEDGSYGSAFGLENPVAATEEYDHFIRTNRVIGNVEATYFLTDNLSATAKFGLDASAADESVFFPSILQQSAQGGITEGSNNYNRLIQEYRLGYSNQFGTTSVNAIAAAIYQRDDFRSTYFETNDLPADNFPNAGSAANPGTVTGNVTGDALNSYLANVNLGFDNTLFVSASVRADGSSRFVNDRWGIFPGASAGVNLVNAGVLDDGTFDLFKLRTSFGVTGNNNIDNFVTRELYSAGATYLTTPGIAPDQLGNPDLVWETTNQFDFGIDLAFMDNKIAATVEYYIKNTSDLILNRPVPTTSGFLTVPENIGDMRNTGIDLALTFTPYSDDFSWSTTITAGFLTNEVVEVFNDQPLDFGFATRIEEGQPLGSFYGWVTDGIFQNQAEVEAHAIQPGAAPGDYRFQDLNGDGVINDSDRTFIGQALPDVTGGIDNKFSYKGFDLNVFVQFSFGNEVFNNNLAFAEGLNSVFAPTVRSFEGAWRAEGDGDDFPRIVNGDPNNNRRESDRFVEDGSFVRIKTAQLAYNVPKTILGDGFRSLRVYVQGTNLVTWTDYSWFDPEVSTFGDANVALGTDFLTNPLARTIQFGLNLGF